MYTEYISGGRENKKEIDGLARRKEFARLTAWGEKKMSGEL